MQIKSAVSYLSEAELEAFAIRLLRRYEREIEPIDTPPVPVERIADFLLELGLEWQAIPDTEDEPILAYLQPETQTIHLNERRLPYFEEYPGSYEFTLAHEIGHYLLHVTADDTQPTPPLKTRLYRNHARRRDRREWQAEQFAGYLLLPSPLLLPAIEPVDLHHWPTLYRLRDQFQVSITALRIRLERLGLLYVAPNGRLYPTPESAIADLHQDSRRLMSRGKLLQSLGQTAQAQEAYQQALEIFRRLGDQQHEAHCAWALGSLYLKTDPAQAIDLMAICVAYEQKIGHPEADADACYVAQLRARYL